MSSKVEPGSDSTPRCAISTEVLDLGGRVQVLLEELAGRDADAVVGGRDVHDVGRVDVEADARGLGVGPQLGRPAVVPDLRTLVALRVAEEELHVGRLARLGLGDRVGLLRRGLRGRGRLDSYPHRRRGADRASGGRWWAG